MSEEEVKTEEFYTINEADTVGGYIVNPNNPYNKQVKFLFSYKPSWFHRVMTRFFLGWKWEDH